MTGCPLCGSTVALDLARDPAWCLDRVACQARTLEQIREKQLAAHARLAAAITAADASLTRPNPRWGLLCPKCGEAEDTHEHEPGWWCCFRCLHGWEPAKQARDTTVPIVPPTPSGTDPAA